MGFLIPIAIGAALFTAPAFIPPPNNKKKNQKTDSASNDNRDTSNSLVAENNVNEAETLPEGQRNFGENYKEQELYYASQEYRETLEPYEKSSSGNQVNSDKASARGSQLSK